VTTQDPLRQRALVVPDKDGAGFTGFHEYTLEALKELVQAAGLEHPNQIRATHIVRRGQRAQGAAAGQLAAFRAAGRTAGGHARRCTLAAHGVRAVLAARAGRELHPRRLDTPTAPASAGSSLALEGCVTPGVAQQFDNPRCAALVWRPAQHEPHRPRRPRSFPSPCHGAAN